MERTNEQASTTNVVMLTIKKRERNCIATHLYNKHLRLADLLGKHLRLSGPSKGVALCKHLRENAAWQACSLEPHNNKEKITHSNILENVFYLAKNAKGNIRTNASINPPSTNA
jgi:hypothetical protein